METQNQDFGNKLSSLEDSLQILQKVFIASNASFSQVTSSISTINSNIERIEHLTDQLNSLISIVTQVKGPHFS